MVCSHQVVPSRRTQVSVYNFYSSNENKIVLCTNGIPLPHPQHCCRGSHQPGLTVTEILNWSEKLSPGHDIRARWLTGEASAQHAAIAKNVENYPKCLRVYKCVSSNLNKLSQYVIPLFRTSDRLQCFLMFTRHLLNLVALSFDGNEQI